MPATKARMIRSDSAARKSAAAQANQIIRKRGDILGVEPVVAESREEGVVTRFAVFAVGFQLGNRHCLGEFGHLRQPLAVCRDCFGASIGKRMNTARRRRSICRFRPAGGKKRCVLSAASSPRTRWRRLSGIGTLAEAAVSMRDIAAKSKVSRWAEPIEACSRSGAHPFFRVAEIRAQDVGQFHDQLVDLGAEFLRLLILQGLPGMLEQPERHRLVAIDDLAVALERGAQTVRLFASDSSLLAPMRSAREIAKTRQRPGRAFRDQLADLPLEPAGVLAHALAVAVRGDCLDRAIEQSRTATAPVVRRRPP